MIPSRASALMGILYRRYIYARVAALLLLLFSRAGGLAREEGERRLDSSRRERKDALEFAIRSVRYSSDGYAVRRVNFGD